MVKFPKFLVGVENVIFINGIRGQNNIYLPIFTIQGDQVFKYEFLHFILQITQCIGITLATAGDCDGARKHRGWVTITNFIFMYNLYY